MGLKESGLRGSLRNVSVGITAIPDSEDLHFHYDFSASSTTTSFVEDQTGNGRDLDSGSFTSTNATIGGNQAAEFDDDLIYGSFSTVDQPLHMFAVIEMPDPSGSDAYVWDGADSSSVNHVGFGARDGDMEQIHSNSFGASQIVGEPIVVNVLYDGSNGKVRLNGGEEEVSGDSESRPLQDGITVGARSDDDSNGTFNALEMLAYPENKEDVEEDVESYLSSRGSINLA